MSIQADDEIRVVALSNLRAMCEYVSGVCHRWHVSRITKSRVYVTYTNPDEYGTEHPVTAAFPCYPSGFAKGDDGLLIVLDVVKVTSGRDEYDPVQFFWPIIDGPKMFRANETAPFEPFVESGQQDNRNSSDQ